MRYTYTLFHTHCLAVAGDLLDKTPQRGDKPKMERPAIGVIILSAAGLEAAVNHAVETSFRPDDLLEEVPVERLAKTHVSQETNPLAKLALLAEAMGIELDKGAEPWQSADDLYALRNALVHYESKPVITSTEGPVFWERERLKNRAQVLGLWEILEEEGGTWLDVFLNRPCAEWAYETTKAATKALRESPWR